jgi:hypothetical protein
VDHQNQVPGDEAHYLGSLRVEDLVDDIDLDEMVSCT